MDPIKGAGAAGGVVPAAARGRVPAGGFSVPAGGAAPAGAEAAGGAAEVSLAGLLALQEAADEPVRDRQARRRGHDLLAELAALQRELLAGPPDLDRLERLAALAREVPDAADPRLRAVVQAISLRARVELARYGAV